LLDLWLPIVDGYEVARRLRAAPSEIPLRIVSLSGANPDPARCQAAGIDGCLVKPSDLDQILEAIGAEPFVNVPVTGHSNGVARVESSIPPLDHGA
jgi:CheY-like chemotaxis protein